MTLNYFWDGGGEPQFQNHTRNEEDATVMRIIAAGDNAGHDEQFLSPLQRAALERAIRLELRAIHATTSNPDLDEALNRAVDAGLCNVFIITTDGWVWADFRSDSGDGTYRP